MKRIIPLYDFFTYAGKSSLDFRVRISGNGTHHAPERHIETVIVPGRNGDLTISDERFGTVDQSYDGFIVDDFMDNYSGLVNWLLSHRGNQRLEDSYHPDEFRMARFTGPIDPQTVMDEAGKFTLTFKCQPQRFLKIGEHEIIINPNQTKAFKNPTIMKALPMITVSGTGTFTISQNGTVINTVELDQNNGATVIDSELQDCYEGTINRNPAVTFTNGYPVFEGNAITEIAAGTGITLRVKPRWWRL